MNYTQKRNEYILGQKKKTLQLLRRVSLLLEIVKFSEIVLDYGVRLRNKILKILHTKYIQLFEVSHDREYYEMAEQIEELYKGEIDE